MDVNELERLLVKTHYDTHETRFLVNGFRNGFDLGYEGPENRQDTSENIPLQVGDRQELWDKIMKEVSLKRVAGPFDAIPFHYYIQSPIGLVPKANNQTHLIFHLSFNFKKSGNASINDSTPDDLCSVKYKDLDYAIKCVFKWASTTSNGHQQIRFAKSDVKSTFRLVPLRHQCWNKLVFKAIDPVSRKTKYFCDKVLPFGASISCSHFQRFSSAIRHILEVKMNCPWSIL